MVSCPKTHATIVIENRAYRMDRLMSALAVGSSPIKQRQAWQQVRHLRGCREAGATRLPNHGCYYSISFERTLSHLSNEGLMLNSGVVFLVVTASS